MPKAIGRILFVIGIVLLILALMSVGKTRNFVKNSGVAMGEVVDLVEVRSSDSYVYKPVVEYRAWNGDIQGFLSNTGSNPAMYTIGESVEVIYDPQEPENARINGFFGVWGGFVILLICGLVFTAAGLFNKAMAIQKEQKLSRLKAEGYSIQASIKSINMNHAFSVNGVHPYKIHAQWQNPETSQVHLFTSDNIWYDPSDYLENDEVTVLIDKEDPKYYHFDTSFLPQTA